MKTIYLLTILTLVSFKAFSQDTLFTKKGEKIFCRVIEINSNQVMYKGADDPRGQYSRIDQSKLSSIHYANGTSDIFLNPQDTSYHNGTIVTYGYNTAEQSNGNNAPVDQNPDPTYSNRNSNNAVVADAAIVGFRVLGVILRIALEVATSSQFHNNHSSYNSGNHYSRNHPRGH